MRLAALFQHGTTKRRFVQKSLRFALFSALLLLGAYLRVTGLSWGLNSGYGHDLNFQPDEFVSLRGVLQLDLLAGRIKVPDAYFEGTFNYYLWAVPQAVLKLGAKKHTDLTDSVNAQGHADLLYISRWMSVLVDLSTIVIVFLAIREATRRFYPSLLGALCYAVLPMQVIYAHFMRTHILSNLLCALVIWLSFKLRKSQSWQLLVLVGLISGLGAATRYPVGIIVAIPCLYLLFDGGSDVRSCRLRFSERAKNFFASQVWLIGLAFVIGLFLGHPMLFLDTSSVTKAITNETLKYASLQQFSRGQLVNLSVVWRYVTYLIPFAMYPVLWLVPYCAILYLLFRRDLYSLSVPILIFSFVYLYFMGKGYLGPYFARITILLFPGFCVLVGIACDDLQLKVRNKRTAAVVLSGALLLIFVPSLVFDLAYDRAMQQKDAREVLRQDLQNFIGEVPTRVGILHYGPYFYTAMPAAKPLTSDKVVVQLQDAGEDADYLLVGLTTQIDPAQINAIVRQIEAQGKFRYARGYRVPVRIFGHEFKLMRFPQDMTYPFPLILLFRSNVPNVS
ncbi:MAG TPA: glycosyltransferase family 39 protein [Candidatus Udaeobacter sp.]|jgi:dolichyl-phosphate-mannose-protein mannosyltransferase|nr:glycosyltransferase family 39 protein [Candidatus Udaeobacter sp.]